MRGAGAVAGHEVADLLAGVLIEAADLRGGISHAQVRPRPAVSLPAAGRLVMGFKATVWLMGNRRKLAGSRRPTGCNLTHSSIAEHTERMDTRVGTLAPDGLQQRREQQSARPLWHPRRTLTRQAQLVRLRRSSRWEERLITDVDPAGIHRSMARLDRSTPP